MKGGDTQGDVKGEKREYEEEEKKVKRKRSCSSAGVKNDWQVTSHLQPLLCVEMDLLVFCFTLHVTFTLRGCKVPTALCDIAFPRQSTGFQMFFSLRSREEEH